jgi:hypothetical protein
MALSGPASTSSPTLVRNFSASPLPVDADGDEGASSTVIRIFSTGVTRQ